MAPSAQAEGFPRRHRFDARGSFGALLGGARKARGELAVVHAGAGRPGASRLGIALTRRLVPLATERNRVKRLVREAFRRHRLKTAGVDCVVTLRGKWRPGDARALDAEIRALFERIAARPAG
ncbi:MAG TPA: ribonuclease P protein component [Usitatibacter sp.]|nr:ribonuclease P protein component [Usitatibacter sp.]